MPRINIYEKDLTTVSAASLESEVVYIPGFVTNDTNYISASTAVEAGIPTLCSSIAEFESYFGRIPAVFATAQEYPSEFSTNATPAGSAMFNEKDVDPSYVMARELIGAGIPVLYEKVNGDEQGNPTVAAMYEVLNGTNAGFNNLTDVGEYTVKYITSGGYPVFEFGGKYLDIESDDITIVTGEGFSATWDRIGKQIFLNNSVVKDIQETTVFQFVYSEQDGWKYNSAEVDLSEFGIVITCNEGVANPPAGATISVEVKVSRASIIANKMLEIAANRGDCVALIDHTNSPNRELAPTSQTSVYAALTSDNSNHKITANGEYGAMFTPWCSFTYNYATKASAYDIKNKSQYQGVEWLPTAMPGSYAYLLSLALSIRNNPSWLAIAGVSRGVVPNFTSLYINKRMSNAIADSYQRDDMISINPITNIKPYGFTIWGNRTLKDNSIAGGLTALSFLNLRNMVSDIKKQAYTAAKRCLFEQNTDVLWLNFKSMITPLLDRMQTGYGLSGYKIVREESDNRAKVVCTIRLFPIYAVERFDITIELTNDDISID